MPWIERDEGLFNSGQWLRLSAPNAGNTGQSGQGTKIPHAPGQLDCTTADYSTHTPQLEKSPRIATEDSTATVKILYVQL